MAGAMLTQMILGTAGGVVGELLEFWYSSRANRPFRLPLAIVIALGSGVITVIYFTFMEKLEPSIILPIHYGIFVSLLIEHIRAQRSYDEIPAPSFPSFGSAAPAAPVLVLNGFLQVYGVGTLGAFLVELHTLYSQRKKRLEFPLSYWVITALMVLSGGLVATVHGLQNVSALLALQLGASAPLIIKRLRG